jgi:nucleoid-associated protein EbfC
MTDDAPNKMEDLFKTVQQAQQELGRVQAELSKKTVEGSAGGGMVKAVVNGRQQLVSLHIEDDVATGGDTEMLQDLIVAAVNQALSKAAELAQEDFSQIAGGLSMKIPGLS